MGTVTTRSPSTCPSHMVLERLAAQTESASIIVNTRFEILSCAGPIAKYLTSPDPRPGSALAAFLEPSLTLHALRALRGATAHGAVSDVSVSWRGGATTTIHARRVRTEPDGALLISFLEDADDAADAADAAAPDDDITEPSSMTSMDTGRGFAPDQARLEDALRNLELINGELILANQEAAALSAEARLKSDALDASLTETQAVNAELAALNGQLVEARSQRESEACELRDILDSADVATLALDADFNIRFFTPSATGLFGLIASDVGRPLSDLAPRVVDDHLTDDIKRALDGAPAAACEVRTRDGRWFLRKASPRRGAGRAGVVVTYTAIAEAKRVEHELRTSLSHLESVLEAVRRPLLTFDRALSVRFVNKACRDLFDAGCETFVGLPLGETPAGALAPFVAEILWPEPSAFGDVENHRIEISTPQKSKLVLLATLRRIEGSGDDSFLFALEDVTEKERVEESLAAVTRGLEKANRLKSQFLAAASHDLRQPLQTMCLLSAILRRKLTGRALQLSAKFDETIEAMNGVVNAILDINQLEAGAITPVIQNFPADMLLNKLFAEFDTLVQAKGLDWRLVGCDATIKSDPRLLIQILRNLVSNAVKFTASGKILIGCRRRDGAIAIEVLDSGPGIKDCEVSSIFEFFHKGAETATGSNDGLGLGLAIVRHLADMLGHEVKVDTRFGEGSRFSVLVPLGDEDATIVAKPARLPPPVMKERSCRVLVVEDEPSVRESLQMLLEAEGHVVSAAASGPDGLRLVESGACQPDLVIVDYSVPGGMNGLETIDALRAMLNRKTPAIALSGDISSAAIEKIRARADVHLTKPVQADDLLDAMLKLRTQARPAESCLAGSPPLAPPARDERRLATTIYVVDDDPSVRSSLRELLESCGYPVTPLANGAEALQGLAFGPQDCLILDANLPDMDGFEVLAQLRAAPARPSVIMITGRGDVDTAVRAMREGACDFLEKPFSPEQLLASIDRALGAKTDRPADVRQDSRQLIARLTERQRAVLELIVQGRANKVIANDLGIGQRTVESHRATLMKKLGVRTFADLIRIAIAAR